MSNLKSGDKLIVINDASDWIRSLPFKTGDIVEFMEYMYGDYDSIIVNIDGTLSGFWDIGRFKKINNYSKEYR